ncbi:MAG: hypothetical protein KF861_12540 [Planctomycetaceae bacterium]|nr:hypothetical protein [Planctomycetaceae bacterium]
MTRAIALTAAALLTAGLTFPNAFAQYENDSPEAPPQAEPGFDRPDGEPGPGGFGRRGFAPPPSPVMAALDTNKDGELSAEEIANASVALKSLDKNDDGKLTPDEVRPQFAFRGGRGPQGGPPEDRRAARPEPRTPEDGEQPRADRRGPREGDRPRPAGPGPGPRPEFGRGPDFGRGPGVAGPRFLTERVMQLDSDDDEQLSQEEFLALFKSADRDGNGFVSRGELEEVIMERLEQVREQGPPAFGFGPRGPGRGPRGDRGPEGEHPDRPHRPE